MSTQADARPGFRAALDDPSLVRDAIEQEFEGDGDTEDEEPADRTPATAGASA
jgi:aerobic C4-dicarboxylate transport protein